MKLFFTKTFLLLSIVLCSNAQIVQPNVDLETMRIYPNDISVIATNSGPYATTPMKISEKFSEEVPVTAFGAIPGDGKDDYAAIMQALAVRGNHTLYFPPGLFQIFNTNITVTNLHMKWRGAGPSKTQLIAGNTAGGYLPFFIKFSGGPTNAPDSTPYYKDISDMAIQCERYIAANCLVFDGISFSVLRNLNVSGAYNALRFSNCSDIDVFNIRMSTTIRNGSTPPEYHNLTIDANSQRLNFFGGVFHAAYLNNVVLDNVGDIKFFGSSFNRAQTGRPLIVNGGQNILVEGCTFTNNVNGDLLIDKFDAGGGVFVTNRGFTSIGSAFYNGVDVRGYSPSFTGGYIGNITNRADSIGANYTSVKYGVKVIDLATNTTFLPVINVNTGIPEFKLPTVAVPITALPTNWVTPFNINWDGDIVNYGLSFTAHTVGAGNVALNIARKTASPNLLAPSMTFDSAGNIALGFTNVASPSSAARLYIDGGLNVGGFVNPGNGNLHVANNLNVDVNATVNYLFAGGANISGTLGANIYATPYGYLQVAAEGNGIKITSPTNNAYNTFSANVIGGANVTVTTNGNKQLVINSTAAGGGTNYYYTSNYNNTYYTTNLVSSNYYSTNFVYLTTNTFTTVTNTYSTNIFQTNNYTTNVLVNVTTNNFFTNIFNTNIMVVTNILLTTNVYTTSVFTNTYYSYNTNIYQVSTNNYYVTTNVNNTFNVTTNFYQTVTNNIVNTNVYYTTNYSTYYTTNITQNITTNNTFNITTNVAYNITTNTYTTITTNVNNYYTDNKVKVNGVDVSSPNFQNSPSILFTNTGPNIKANIAPAPVMWFAVSDETTPLTAGVNKRRIRAPFKFQLTDTRASISIPVSSGGATRFNLYKNGAILTTSALVIEQGDKSSVYAQSFPTYNTYLINDDEEISVEVISTGTGATGAKICIFGVRIP